MNQAQPAKVRAIDVESQPVRCIETDDGKRVSLCDCPKFKERATRAPRGLLRSRRGCDLALHRGPLNRGPVSGGGKWLHQSGKGRRAQESKLPASSKDASRASELPVTAEYAADFL